MKLRVFKRSFSTVEVLVVIAILAVLVSIVLGVGRRVRVGAEIRLAKSTLGVLVTALEQFELFGYHFKDADAGNAPDYTSYVFPPDSRVYNPFGQWYFGANDPFFLPDVLEDTLDKPGAVTVTDDEEAYRSCVLMYFFLNRVPTSRAIISAISERFIVSDGESIFFDNNSYPLMRVLDPWGTELRYWYNGTQGFPVIESAGPDRNFGDVDVSAGESPSGMERDNIKSTEL